MRKSSIVVNWPFIAFIAQRFACLCQTFACGPLLLFTFGHDLLIEQLGEKPRCHLLGTIGPFGRSVCWLGRRRILHVSALHQCRPATLSAQEGTSCHLCHSSQPLWAPRRRRSQLPLAHDPAAALVGRVRRGPRTRSPDRISVRQGLLVAAGACDARLPR